VEEEMEMEVEVKEEEALTQTRTCPYLSMLDHGVDIDRCRPATMSP